MPYKAEKIRLPEQFDRRRKLTDEQKQEIVDKYSTGFIVHQHLKERY